MTQCNIELFRDTVAFTLTLRKFNNRRKGDMAQVETDTKKDRLKLSKQLLESPELDAIGEYLGDLYKWCTLRSNPSFFKDGIYLVKCDQIEAFEAKLNQARTELDVLISAFQDNYEMRKTQARADLNGMFREKDYPDVRELPKYFGIEWNWISFGVPENLPAELRAAEAAKIEGQFKDAEAQIMAALREGFAEIVTHLTERLTSAPGEKKKIFRDSLFENLTEFISTFSARNLVNDAALEEMVTRANGILSTVRGEDAASKAQILRDSSMMREDTARAFQQLKAAVDSTVMEKPSRKFELE